MNVYDEIRAQAQRRPDATAVIDDRGPKRFGELLQAVERRARNLPTASLHSTTDLASLVLLDHFRSFEWIELLLAAWHAGRVPVLVDPDDPPHRRQAIMTALARGRRCVTPEAAYIAFTSGSTGQPKGVVLGHDGLAQMVAAQRESFALHEHAVAGWMLNPGFDASLSDVLTALSAGAAVRIHAGPVEDLEWLNGLTHIDLPPSLLPALAARGVPDSLQTIIFGGEVANARAVRTLARTHRLLNAYGPTETTVCSSLKLCSPEWKPGDIGQPIAGTQFRIRDDKDNDAPPGTVGELLIVGAGVAIAAIDDASVGRWLTVDGQRAYRTGDLVIERSDGFTYVGRRDRQVQLRGKRVQLEGIEHVLMGVSGVDSARVTVERGQLRAHYEGNAPLDRVEAVVERNLRPHERPIVAHRERLPRTSTLKAADEGHDANVDGLARIVANATGLTAIDVDAPIGTLGIDSVDRLTIGLQAQALGLSVAPDDLDDSETLAQIARHARPSGIDVSMLDDWAEAEFQRLRPKDWPNKKKRSGPEGSAFLISGATGMLGATFIEALRHRGHRALICLSRRAIVRDDIEVVRGDITQPLWGLHPTVIEALRDRVGHVVHLAGAVDLVRNYRALHPSNVRSTVHAIELAGRLGARLHHASSLSVFAESTAVGDFSPTTSLKAARRVTSGYAQSKWVAEAIVHRARAIGITATVTRFGLLTPIRSGGRDQLSRVIRGLMRLGAVPPSLSRHLRFDCTPVDFAAGALAEICDKGDGVYHVASPRPAQASDLLEALALPGAAGWPPRMPETSDEALALAAFARTTGQAHGAGDLFLATDRRFLTPRTTALLGETSPEPTLHHLRRLVRMIGAAA